MMPFKKFGYYPLECLDRGWFFYDETWSERIGPFPSKIAAAAALLEYCDELNAPHDPTDDEIYTAYMETGAYLELDVTLENFAETYTLRRLAD